MVLIALAASAVRGAEKLVFSDEFGRFDLSKWQHEVTMGGGGNKEFEWYTNNRTNSFVRDGALYLQPTLTSEKIGEEALNNGYVNLGSECTDNAFGGCQKDASAAGEIINPVMSARIRTKNSFAFTYGRAEIRAKLPKGDWIWPAIWFLPKNDEYGTWPASGEIDLMESRGNPSSCQAGGRN